MMIAYRSARSCVSMLLVLLFVVGTILPAGAQTPQGAGVAAPAPLPAAVPHTVIPGDTTLTLEWVTDKPERGSVLYGLAPGALGSMVFASPQLVTEHTVTLTGLPPATAIYYLIGIGGAPVGKGGQPYMAMTNAVETAVQAAQPAGAISFTQAEWGVSFVPPAGWQAQPMMVESDGAAGAAEIPQWVGPAGSISVDRLPNDEGLTPAAWYARHRDRFDTQLVQTLGELTVGGAATLVVGQAQTCLSVPLLVAYIGGPAGDGAMYEVMLADNGGRATAPEFTALLSSWRFGAQPDAEASAIDATLSRFPSAPAGVDCGGIARAADAPARCPGAAMTVPSAGPDIQPWGCFNSDPTCYPYGPVSPRGAYFRLPHRGIDIGGETGVSPVYATFSGVVYLYRDNNILLRFDGAFAGKSAWMAHMASYDGRIDYRIVKSGTRVAEGQLLGYVGYRITDGPPHLHISYNMNAYGSEAWPSIEPTRMLSIKDAVWYDGWNAERPLECSAGSADTFEPDNFPNMAAVATTDGSPQRHDFHAPGDEDYVRFYGIAGRSYMVETTGLDAGNDTQLAVMNAAGTVVLAENDDAAHGTFASQLLFSPTTTGNYLARVRHYSFRGYAPFRPQPTYTYPVYGPGTGYSLVVEEVVPNVLWNRPALATSYDATRGEKASFAIDGDVSTRWGSLPGAAPTQWWWGETGNKVYNTVTIRWEPEHAGRYFVGWSTNNVTYSGYYFSVPGPGWYAHDLLALRSARYVGIRMEQYAPGQDKYAMSEVAAYRRTGPVAADEEAGDVSQPITLAPEGDLVTITLDGLLLDHEIYLPAVGR